MKKNVFFRHALIWALVLMMAPYGAFAQGGAPVVTFTPEELDQMLAPVALYPDSLLAQILIAATYPDQVTEADRWIKSNSTLQGDALNAALDTMNWDLSVKALAPFPQVLAMMADQAAWTERLGEAFVAQQADVMDAVQKLRAKAYAAGNLKTTAEQRVVVKGDTYEVEPVNPEVVYVPRYDPTVIYGPWWYPAYPPYAYYPVWPGVALGVGIGIGLGFWGAVAVGPVWGWGWGSWGWGGHNVNINVNRNININSRTANISRNISTTNFHSVAARTTAGRSVAAHGGVTRTGAGVGRAGAGVGRTGAGAGRTGAGVTGGGARGAGGRPSAASVQNSLKSGGARGAGATGGGSRGAAGNVSRGTTGGSRGAGATGGSRGATGNVSRGTAGGGSRGGSASRGGAAPRGGSASRGGSAPRGGGAPHGGAPRGGAPRGGGGGGARRK